MFTPDNADDSELLKGGRFLQNIKGKLCVDKGYIGQTLFEKLFLNGIQLVTKVKNNMKNSLPLKTGYVVQHKAKKRQLQNL